MTNSGNREITTIISCFLTASILVVMFFAGLMIRGKANTVFEIPDGWEVKRGEKTYENIRLEEMADIFKDIRWNETVYVSHPLNVQSHDPLILRVYARLSSVRVMVDGKQIYSYGISDLASHRMVGSGYHFVLMPTRYYGKHLTIEFRPSEEGSIKAAPEIIITPADEAITEFAKERSFGIFSGLLLLLAGLLLVVLSILAVYFDRRFYPFGFIGVFSVASGLWCLSMIKALQLFSGDITLNSILEYLCMYFMPVPVLFLSRHFRTSASPRIRKVILAAGIVAAVFFSIAFSLQVCGILDVTRIVIVYHILLIPEGIVVFFAGKSKWRRMKASERLFQIGLILIILVMGMEYAIYYAINLLYEVPTRLNIFITPAAILTLDMVMLIGFLLEIYDMRLKDNERERLNSLAFMDQMTGLLNRGMCEKRFAEIRESGKPFAMLNMDLNGLKLVNDCYGHLMGDQYINSFSDILVKVMEGKKELYRMGGDEFLYISTSDSREELEKKVKFIKRLEKITARDDNIPFSIDASFGIACSDETESGDPEDVYILADKRMYQMKKDLKKERK